MVDQSAEVTRKMLRDKHNKKNPSQPIPVFPNWVYDRPALIGDFMTSTTPVGEQAPPIGNCPSKANFWQFPYTTEVYLSNGFLIMVKIVILD